MMINNDNENSTNMVTTNKSNSISSDENQASMSLIDNSNQTNGEEQSVQNMNNDLNENESQEKQLIPVENEQQNNDDEFIRITAAHQMLTEAQTYDEQKNYPAALHLYRICVDLLLEELMFTEGTDQSRIYLREKCTAIMDRIDVLKTMLEPIPPPTSTSEPLPLESSAEPLALPPTTTTDEQTPINEQTTKLPTDELNSLHLS